METWEGLQARLFHLGYLGEELPRVVSQPGVSAWLYRVIAAEAGEVARIAGEYIADASAVTVVVPFEATPRQARQRSARVHRPSRAGRTDQSAAG